MKPTLIKLAPILLLLASTKLIAAGNDSNKKKEIKLWLKCLICESNCTGASVVTIYRVNNSGSRKEYPKDHYECNICKCHVSERQIALKSQRQRIRQPKNVPPQNCSTTHQFIEYEDEDEDEDDKEW